MIVFALLQVSHLQIEKPLCLLASRRLSRIDTVCSACSLSLAHRRWSFRSSYHSQATACSWLSRFKKSLVFPLLSVVARSPSDPGHSRILPFSASLRSRIKEPPSLPVFGAWRAHCVNNCPSLFLRECCLRIEGERGREGEEGIEGI